MIRASGDEVSRVGAKGAVPDPALMAGQSRLEGERVRIAIVVQLGCLLDIDLPNLGGVIRRTGGQLLDVGREEDARDVVFVRGEVRDGLQLSAVEVLDQGPNKDVTL